MELTDLQRLKKVVKWLIFCDFGDNEKELAEILGYKKSSFSQILNGKVPISDKFIDKIISLDKNINKVWIKDGIGEMFNTSQQTILFSQIQENSKYTEALEKINTLQEQIIYLMQENKRLSEENSAFQESPQNRVAG